MTNLGARVVELSSLADLQTAGAENENLLVAVHRSSLVDGISLAEALVLACFVNELLEQETSVLRATGGLRVELHTVARQKTVKIGDEHNFGKTALMEMST